MKLEQFIQKFNDSEVTEIECKLSRSDVQRLKQMHEEKLDILEALEAFDRRINITIENINSITGTFPQLRYEMVHDIDIYKRCINRLWDRYFKID